MTKVSSCCFRDGCNRPVPVPCWLGSWKPLTLAVQMSLSLLLDIPGTFNLREGHKGLFRATTKK